MHAHALCIMLWQAVSLSLGSTLDVCAVWVLCVRRDMLRFADADEAEAVYSMVSLTQAAHRQQGEWQHGQAADIKGPTIEVSIGDNLQQSSQPYQPYLTACSCAAEAVAVSSSHQ